jgi:hypothetical protein
VAGFVSVAIAMTAGVSAGAVDRVRTGRGVGGAVRDARDPRLLD